MKIKTFEQLAIADRQRIDIRVFVGEVDRMRGEFFVRDTDPRLLLADEMPLAERVEFLRQLYAEDMQRFDPQFHWENERFEQIKFRRCMELQDNIIRDRSVDGPYEQLINMLELPYLKVSEHTR